MKRRGRPLSQWPPAAIQQLPHCGGSCGQPGGCNNMSPNESNLDLRIGPLPAEARFALWKDLPASPDHPPDLKVILDLR